MPLLSAESECPRRLEANVQLYGQVHRLAQLVPEGCLRTFRALPSLSPHLTNLSGLTLPLTIR